MKKCDNKSAGVLVWDEGRLLLIQRNTFPYGFAVPAGHVDNHGDYEDAAKAELHEEVGILATSLRLEIEGFAINPCRRIGGNHHYWKIYSTQVFRPELMLSQREVRRVEWLDKAQLVELAQNTVGYLKNRKSAYIRKSEMALEPIWLQWFSLLKMTGLAPRVEGSRLHQLSLPILTGLKFIRATHL